MRTKQHPGVYVPPPLIYVAFFFVSVLLQKQWPLSTGLLNTATAQIIGWVFISLWLIVLLPSLHRFIVSKNTLVPIKPASSLQTTGIYAISRNPMYLSLMFLYCGLAIFKGNWWTFIMLVPLMLIVELYIIRREELYLQDAFGASFERYKQKVRRWL